MLAVSFLVSGIRSSKCSSEWIFNVKGIRPDLGGTCHGMCCTTSRAKNKMGCKETRLGRYISFDPILFVRS